VNAVHMYDNYDSTTTLRDENQPTSTTSEKPDEKHELKEEQVPDVLGNAWSTQKKWRVLTIVCLAQCSMNYNSSVYSNGVSFLTEKFAISEQAARVGQCVYLVAFGIGCELWAPWSEELGRRVTLQSSIFLVNSE
jgi:hypothetical protein